MQDRDRIHLGYEERVGAFSAWGWTIITLVIAAPIILLLLVAALNWLL